MWQALTAAGRDQRALGDPQRARASFTEAIATIESLRLDVAGGEADQQRAFESRLVPYHELLSIALTEGATAEAFRVAEQSKARVVLDILRGGRVDITTTMSDSEQAEERALNRRVANVSAQALAERRHVRSDPLRVASLEGELVRARLAREDFETRLYATHPDLRTQRGETIPVTVDQAALVLDDSATAALEYVVTDRDVWLFVLTRSGGSRAGTGQLTVEHLPIAPRALTALVERLTHQLAERDLQFRATAAQLYDALLRPVTVALAGRSKLIVVPDAALWQVPFQALWNSTTSRYVIETHAVAYAPSVTVLAETRRRRTDRGRSTADALDAEVRPTLLAFGNPALAAPVSGTSRGDRNASPAPLPAAEREVKALGQLYGAARSRVYTGAQAREDRLKLEAGRSFHPSCRHARHSRRCQPDVFARAARAITTRGRR